MASSQSPVTVQPPQAGAETAAADGRAVRRAGLLARGLHWLGTALLKVGGGQAPGSVDGPGLSPERLAALQRSEQQLRLAEQVARVGSFDWNPVTGELHWSDEHFRLWGHAPGALTPSYVVFRAGVHPDDVALLEAQLQQALAGTGHYDWEHRVVWPDGTERRIHGRGEVMFDGAGTAVRMIGTVRDTTAEWGAQAALAASVDNLTLTLNATGDGIFASDARSSDQPLLFVNDRLLQMFDVPRATAAGLTPAGVIDAARRFFIDPDREVARIVDLIRGNLAAEDRLELNDGRVLLRRCVPTLAEGRHVRVWGFRDITAQENALRALRVAEAQQRALVDAFPGYIACIDADMRFVYANQRVAALVGWDAQALVGQRAGLSVDRSGETRFADDARRALAGEAVVAERLQPGRDGRPDMHLLVTLAPGVAGDGRQRLVYAFGTDITALKQTEAALLQAKEEAEQASRAKSAFLSSMSHELRTPMNAVLGFTQLMQAQGGLAPRQREHLTEIMRGGQHLLSLINDLLDLARIEAGRMAVQAEPLALPAVAAESLALLQPAALRRRIGVSLPVSTSAPPVLADRTRLKQVLVNLLGNAVKYNREGGWVRVEWQADDRQATVSVRDGGPGLSAEQCERLFQPFERLGAERSAVEGTGIGLALCRRLVGLMGGEIGVHSRPGEGSRFWFTLPLASPEALRALALPGGALASGALPEAAATPASRPLAAATGLGSPEPALSPAAARSVLYIEDNPVNAMLMEGLLEALPQVRMLHAATSAAGLVMAERAQPDLILLDIMLPEMDGFEVQRRLRTVPSLAAVPVVAVSANALPQDRSQAHAAGFAGYLAKPLDVPVLLHTVAHLLHLPVPAEAP